MHGEAGASEAMDVTSRRILGLYDQLERDSLDLHTFFEFVAGNPPAERERVMDSVGALAKQGLLEADRGGDFYRRTEEGRLAIAGPRDITLYTREGCHLCDEARAQLLQLASEFGVPLHEVDIDDDSVLRERYTNDVPVILLGRKMVAQHRLDARRLRRQLQEMRGCNGLHMM
jgi:glutaredoxin